MTRDDLLDLFRKSGALLDGHFRLTSGLHSSGYLQCALVLQHPRDAETLGRAIGDRTRALRPTVVLSAARSACARCSPSVKTARSRCGADSSSPKPIACWSSRTC